MFRFAAASSGLAHDWNWRSPVGAATAADDECRSSAFKDPDAPNGWDNVFVMAGRRAPL